MKEHTPQQIAFEIVKELSSCKYAGDHIIDWGVDSYQHRHQVKVDEADRKIAVALASKALNELFDRRAFVRSMGM